MNRMVTVRLSPTLYKRLIELHEKGEIDAPDKFVQEAARERLEFLELRFSFWTVIRILNAIQGRIRNATKIISKLKISNETFYRHIEFCSRLDFVRREPPIKGKHEIPIKNYYLTERGNQLLSLLSNFQ